MMCACKVIDILRGFLSFLNYKLSPISHRKLPSELNPRFHRTPELVYFCV